MKQDHTHHCISLFSHEANRNGQIHPMNKLARKSINKNCWIISLVGLLVMNVTARAVDSNIFIRSGLLTPELIMANQSELGITTTQKQQIVSLFDAARREAEPLEAMVRDREEKMAEVIKSNGNSFEATEQLKKLLEAESNVKQLQLRTLYQIRDVLTPEQRKSIAALPVKGSTERIQKENQFKEKADKLRAAFKDLKMEIPSSIASKGKDIENAMKNLDLELADKLVDALILEVGLNEPVDNSQVDINTYESGSTDISELQSRLASIEQKAKEVKWLPTLRKLIQARDHIETAKANQDAQLAGKALTFAEKTLEQSPQ